MYNSRGLNVVIFTDLSGNESCRQVGMTRLMILGCVMVSTLAWNARGVGSNPAPRSIFTLFITHRTVVTYYVSCTLDTPSYLTRGWDVAQALEDVKVLIILSILLNRPICSLDYFTFKPVVHNWSIKCCCMCCPVCRKVHIKDLVTYMVTTAFLQRNMSE